MRELLLFLIFYAFLNLGISFAESDAKDLVTQLGAEHYADRIAATKALGKTSDPKVLPLLTQAVRSDDPEIRLRALEVLEALCTSTNDTVYGLSLDALAELEDHPRFGQRVSEFLGGQTERTEAFLTSFGARIQSSSAYIDEKWTGKPSHLVHLRRLPTLKRLYLRRAPLGDEVAPVLSRLPQLELLNLQKMTGFSNAGLAQLGTLTNLTSLSIEYTKVDDEGLALLAKLPKLARLYAGGTGVRGPGLVHLSKLEDFDYLSFARSEMITDELGPHLAQLEHLRTLGVDHTKITDDILPSFVKCERLQNLYLNGCAIDPKNLSALSAMPTLKRLYAADIEIKPELLERLKKDLEGIDIRR